MIDSDEIRGFESAKSLILANLQYSNIDENKKNNIISRLNELSKKVDDRISSGMGISDILSDILEMKDSLI